MEAGPRMRLKDGEVEMDLVDRGVAFPCLTCSLIDLVWAIDIVAFVEFVELFCLSSTLLSLITVDDVIKSSKLAS